MKVKCACGTTFEAKRSTAVYCSQTCRKRASRAPQVPKPEPEAERPIGKAPDGPSEFEAATLLELDRAGKTQSMLGQQVLIIARRMANGTETGSALASLSKEHSRLMAALGAGGKQADPVDEVQRRRDEKRARAAAG